MEHRKENSCKLLVVTVAVGLLWLGLVKHVLSGQVERRMNICEKMIQNCPREFTYSELRELVRAGSQTVAKRILDSLESDEEGVLYGLKQIETDTELDEMVIFLPEVNALEGEKFDSISNFVSFGYRFDCRDVKASSNFLFWLVRHLELEFLSAAEVLSIVKYVLATASSKYGVEGFVPEVAVNSVKFSEIVTQRKGDDYPSVLQINKAIKRFTSTRRFLDPNGPLDLPDIMNIPRASLENKDKRLMSRLYMLQKSGYLPDIKEKSQMHTVRYIIRATRYYLNRYLSPEIVYKTWSVIYNAITGQRLPEYDEEMDIFILKKTSSDSWPHEADVLDAISYSLEYHGIHTKPLSIHSDWYKKMKKGGYVLTFPKNVKTARWFCRFFQHNLHIFINPYMQFNIWKKAVENLLEPDLGQVNISNDKCFFREDPNFPWPTCHKVKKDDPNYLPFEHDKVLDNLSYEFSRIVHNLNPRYPFSDICQVTRKLILTGSYRREVRQPVKKVKHTLRMRMLERKIYLKRLVNHYNSSKINEPFVGPSNEMLFFFRYYLENDIKISDKVIDKVVREKFMDEDLEDLVKTRNFVLDCTRFYSSIPSREKWSDQEITEMPLIGKKAIRVACSQLFYARPRCNFDLIPPYHPSRESSDMLSGELSLRVFSYLRSIGILNVLPEDFCEDSVGLLATVFGISPKMAEQIRRHNSRRKRARERNFLKSLLKFNTLNMNEAHVSNVEKMNEMLETITKSKLEEKLGIKRNKDSDHQYGAGVEGVLRRYFNINEHSRWEIDELQDLMYLNNKFKLHNSFKKFPVGKFKGVCETQLSNVILKVDGAYLYMEKKKREDQERAEEIARSKGGSSKKKAKDSSRITEDSIFAKTTYELCLSLGNWQESIKKRVKNYIEFLWLKMNNRNIDFSHSNLFSLKLGSESELLTEKGVTRDLNKETEITKVPDESTAKEFYSNLVSSLRQEFSQYEFKLPNTEPIEPEVKRLKKLGYECLYRPGRSDGLLMAEECIKYLYRYGLYILNGIVLDLDRLYAAYLKAFQDTGMELVTFIPHKPSEELKLSFIKTSLYDYNFHRFESLCSLNEIDSDAIWSQLFKTVESISADMIRNLHRVGLILPGTDNNPQLLPKRTPINYICEFVLAILNPNNFSLAGEQSVEDDKIGFFDGQVRKPEYAKGHVWFEVNKITSVSMLDITQRAKRRVSRALMTMYFVQSCIRENMQRFAGVHYLVAATLCRKTKEWRTCDEPAKTQDIYNYLSEITLGGYFEERAAKRLIKGVFVDMISFELQEKTILHLWTRRGMEIPEETLPISYKMFCQISVRIYEYLISERFNNFNDACTYSLEVDNMFRKEEGGEVYTIKRSLANKICSDTYWGQECSNNPVVTQSAFILHREASNLLRSSMHVLPLAPFCDLAYEMAFSRDPVGLCSGRRNDAVRAKIGTVLYSSPDHMASSGSGERMRLHYGELKPPERDPNGVFGSILGTHSYTDMHTEGLGEFCAKVPVSIRDCSLVSGLREKHKGIFGNQERLLKLNKESLRLFFPQLSREGGTGRYSFFDKVPVRVATFSEICELGVSTFELSAELFNTACVASFGKGSVGEEGGYGPEEGKYGKWASNILYCSSTSRWKSCSEWSERNMAKFTDLETLNMSIYYKNSTPLQKAMIDFMAAFITSSMSLFLSGANTQFLSDDKDDLRYVAALKKGYDSFCEASARLYLYNDDLVKSEKLHRNTEVLNMLKRSEVSYSEIRGERPTFGVPYLFFNSDCPRVLFNNLVKFMDEVGGGAPKQLENEDSVLEFSVRVCRKHFSWKSCSFSEEILSAYNPVEISTFEYVASAMYGEFIASDLVERSSILDKSGKMRPLKEELSIFCRISVNIIPRHPGIMRREDIEFEIVNTLPSHMKRFGRSITNVFIDSYKKYNRGANSLRNSQRLKESESAGFSFV